MRSTAVTVAMAAALVLAGCSAPAVEPGAAPDDEAAPEESEATEEDTLDATDPACLVGDWVIAEDQLQSFYDTITADVDGISFDIEGGTGLSFTATEYRYTPDFTLALEIASVGGGEGVTTGSLGGTYTASDGVITTTLGDNDVAVTLTVLGQTLDGTDLLGDFIESDPINDAPFDCSSGAPVLQFETVTGRTPVALTPAG